ncbi:hypothetical protein EDC19_0436 [Natranaerovirga hydrolytica]|uniref:Uncharacterized protein n=1 Tax=Natranaerovirga hydrolytica TaxID=680378 RepID=A0A4R1MY23_9FIRM|nr:hypothetical protein [Natranaerovirga hydrolytica]TCK98025.1 hypothetical protein EDC19_0436 [Natranaerovirga hydrolytica]
MYDFKDVISLSKMKENLMTRNKEYEKITEYFLYEIYFRIFEHANIKGYINKVIEIQTQYIESIIMFRTSDYERERIDFERKVMKDLRLDSNTLLTEKKHQYAVVNCLLNEYKRVLKEEITKYRKEDILIIGYLLSSVMSHISVMSAYIFKHKSKHIHNSEKARDISNLIIDTIGVLYERENMWISNLIGQQKKSCEYLINYVLHSKIDYNNAKISDCNMKTIFIIIDCIINALIMAKSIEDIGRMDFKIEIKDGLLQLDEELSKKFMSFNSISKDDILDIASPKARKIIEDFENIEGYSPKIIEDYILKIDNKFLKIDVAMNLVDDKFLYTDLLKATGYSYDEIYKVVRSLSLKSCSNIDNSIFLSDNRLFRTPIIKVGEYYILSHQLLTEAVHYLSYRILKAKLTVNRDFKQNVEKNYDEVELIDLKELLFTNKIRGDINFQVNKISEIKPFLNKGISGEIDFYFIYKNVLYTMEYKNQDIDSNLFEVCKTYSRNIKYKSKHLKLVEILRDNKELLEKRLGDKISHIRSFLVFKKKNSFAEFYQGTDIYVCSYSDFVEFCKALFEHGEFEKVCDGFLFFR